MLTWQPPRPPPPARPPAVCPRPSTPSSWAAAAAAAPAPPTCGFGTLTWRRTTAGGEICLHGLHGWAWRWTARRWTGADLDLRVGPAASDPTRLPHTHADSTGMSHTASVAACSCVTVDPLHVRVPLCSAGANRRKPDAPASLRPAPPPQRAAPRRGPPLPGLHLTPAQARGPPAVAARCGGPGAGWRPGSTGQRAHATSLARARLRIAPVGQSGRGLAHGETRARGLRRPRTRC
jgi:hypothetical protein